MASDDVIRRLRDGKAELRQMRRSASLHDKLRELVRAQRMYLQIVRTRRPLKPWERPWDIVSDVQDNFIIKNGTIEEGSFESRVSASRSHWVRPHQRWMIPL